MKTRFMKLVTVMAMALSFVGFSFAEKPVNPTFTPAGGEVDADAAIAIATTTADATIFYAFAEEKTGEGVAYVEYNDASKPTVTAGNLKIWAYARTGEEGSYAYSDTVSAEYTIKAVTPTTPAPDTVTVKLMDMTTFQSITSYKIGATSPMIDATMKNVSGSTLAIGSRAEDVALLVILSKDDVKDTTLVNNGAFMSSKLKTEKLTAGEWAISYVLVKGNSTLTAPVALEEGKAVVSKASISKLTVEAVSEEIPEDDPDAPVITFSPVNTSAVDDGTEITLEYTGLANVVFKTFATIVEAKSANPSYAWTSYSDAKPMVTAAKPVLLVGGSKEGVFSYEYKYYRVYEVNPPTSVATPTFEMETDDENEVVSGEVQLSEDGPTTIFIRCATAGATIRYTIDGTDITDVESGLEYSGFVEINSACTLKAKAFAGTISSEQASIKFTTKTTEPETFALKPVVKNGETEVDLQSTDADKTSYKIYYNTEVKTENLSIELTYNGEGATITYALKQFFKDDKTKPLSQTYSGPITVAENMFNDGVFAMTAAIKLGDKTDTICIKLTEEYNAGPKELIIMAGLTQNGATLSNWVKNGNKTEAEMGNWAQACMLGGDGTGIYAYDEIPRNTHLVLGLIDMSFTGELYYTIDGTEADAENGTKYDLEGDGMPLTFPADKDTLVVKVAAFTASDDYATATLTFTQGNWADIPTFVKRNGTAADTIIVLKGESDSLFVATGRDSISAVAAGFAKFAKNDTIAVNKDTVIVAYTKFGKFISDTVKYVYTVEKVVEVNDLAGLNALYKTFDEDQVYAVKGKVVITAIAGSDIYVQDSACATAAGHSMLLYRAGAPAGAKVGDVMTGVKGNLTNYEGLLEMKNVVKTSLSLTGNTATVVIDSIGINELHPDSLKFQNAMLRLVDVEFVNAGDTIKSGENYNIFKGTDTVAFRASYKADYINTPAPKGKGTIVAYGGYYKKAYQISSRNKADMIFTPAVVVPDTVKAPTFSVPAGEVEKDTKVALACATEGAKIYYTTNGSTPDTTSTLYSDEIVIDKEMTIKAIAIKDGMVDSKVAEAKYTIKPVAIEGNELAGVSVYPNPSKGEFYVTVPVNATVEVFAANGQKVTAMAAVAGKNVVRLNNAGIYFVRVRANGQDAIRKVVVR